MIYKNRTNLARGIINPEDLGLIISPTVRYYC